MHFQLCCMLLAASALEVSILVSDRTPISLSSVLELLPVLSALPIVFSANASDLLNVSSWSELVFDYSYSPDMSLRLLETAKESLVLGMYANFPVKDNKAVAGPEETAETLAEYLQAFQLTRLFFADSANSYFQTLGAILTSKQFLSFPQIAHLKEHLSEREVEQFVGRLLKPSGLPIVALYVDEVTGSLLHHALEQYALSKPGYIYFLSDEAAWSAGSANIFYLTDSAAVNATSRLQLEAFLLADRLTWVADFENSVKSSLTYTIHRRFSQCLISILDGVRTISSSPASVAPSFLSLFVTTPTIEVSADFTGLNFDGKSYPSGEVISRGIVVGYAEANRRKDFLPNIKFVNNTVHFGGSVYNHTWALAQISRSRNKLGVAFHAFAFSATVIALYQTFANMSISVPITSIGTSSILSNPETYPLFLRTMSSSADSAIAVIRFVRLFQWKKVAVIYSNTLGDMDFYKRFVVLAEQYNINITNSERYLPSDLTKVQKELNNTLLQIVNSTTRIIVIAHFGLLAITERLYDFGARAGDYMICLYYGLSSTQFGGSDEASMKRRSIIRGALMVIDRYFSGTEGPRVKHLLQEIDGDKYDPVSCVNYDSAMLVAHSVDFMLEKGMHYERGYDLAKGMRSTRFNGCGGIIQIEPGSNDRRQGDYSALNVHLKEASGELELVEAAIYSPSKIQIFTLFPTLQFPDGNTTGFPDSWLPDPDCPYLFKNIRDFSTGKSLSIIICFTYFALSSALLLLIWRKSILPTPSVLHEKRHMMDTDGVFFLTYLVEYTQMISQGPAISLSSSVSNTIDVLSLNIVEIVSYSHGIFWLVDIGICTLVGFYLVLLTVKTAKLDVRLVKCEICQQIGYWANTIGPFMSGPGLLPVISTLLNAFICDRSIGAHYTDSFLYRDCTELCWTGTHLRIATATALLLTLYSLGSTLTLPTWQNYHLNQRLQYFPFYLMVKSITLIGLVTATVALRQFYPLVHSVLYCVVIGMYTLAGTISKPSNYERFNLWTRVLALGLCCYAIVGLAKTLNSALKPLYCFAILAATYTILVITALILQRYLPRYRSLLQRKKEDRYDIIKFAFTCGLRAAEHLNTFKAKQARNKYEDLSSNANGDTPRVPSLTIASKDVELQIITLRK